MATLDSSFFMSLSNLLNRLSLNSSDIVDYFNAVDHGKQRPFSLLFFKSNIAVAELAVVEELRHGQRISRRRRLGMPGSGGVGVGGGPRHGPPDSLQPHQAQQSQP